MFLTIRSTLCGVTYDELNEARNKILDLKQVLEKLHERDPEQEIEESAYRPIDAALSLASQYVGDDPVVREVRQLFAPETAAEGSVVRVVEVLTVVSQVAGILDRRASAMILSEPGATLRRRSTGSE